MAIFVRTERPRTLVRQIRSLIEDHDLPYWEIDSDRDIVYVPMRIKNPAWIHPIIEEQRVVFCILGNENISLTRSAYAIYMSRFLELLITHFNLPSPIIRVSSLPNPTYDRVR